MDHHLTVQDRAVVRQALESTLDLRKRLGEIVPVAGPKHRPIGLPGGDEPIAVVLEFEDPALLVEGLLTARGQHHLHPLGRRRLLLRAQFTGPSEDLGFAPNRVEELIHEEARIDGVVGIGLRAVLVHVTVPLLDEQPVVVPPLGCVHQRPTAPELVASELEEKLAVLEPVFLARNVDPDPLVPADGWTRAVLTLGNDPLEFGVLERVGFHVHGETFVGRVGRGPLGHRPRLQSAVHLEPKVPMQGAGMVLLHDEQPGATGLAHPAEGLRGVGGGPLLAVALQPVVGGR